MSKNMDRLTQQLIKLHPKYIDLSLKRIKILLKKIGDPHLKLPPTIHIAGTNGKGSTLSFIKNIFQSNNFKVHCYISPHLEFFEERFIIANNQINSKELYSVLKYIKKINSGEPITFFEITTAAAFYIFSKNKADFLILETGLGGRLDATNVINKAIINIITPISIDHQDFLGKNIRKITTEKLAIIKPASSVIISKQEDSIKKYIYSKISNINNKKFYFGSDFKILDENKNYFKLKYRKKCINFCKPQLLGTHQIENASTAICAALHLKELGYKFSNKSINEGIYNTTFPGRLEKGYLKKIPVYIDGAHNISGAKKLALFFSYKTKNRWLILGMLNNKDLKKYLINIRQSFNGVIAVKIPYERNSFSTDEISNNCKKLNIKCIKKRNIYEANKYLLKKIIPSEIVVSGSLYLVGRIRKLYL